MSVPVMYRPTRLVHAPTEAAQHGCVCGDPGCRISQPQTVIGVVVENATGPAFQRHDGPILRPAPAASADGWEQVGRYLTNVAMIVGLVLGVALLTLSARQALTSHPDPSVPRDIPEHVGPVGSTSV